MQLRYAIEQDREGISNLWSACFPGDETFRDYFLNEMFDPKNSFVYIDDDRVVSMAHVIPMEFRYHSRTVPVGYIFAVGTDPEYRGRGLASGILEHIFTVLSQRDIPLAILVPQKDNLFDYYRRYGFAEVFGLTHEKLRRVAIPADKISDRFDLLRSTLTSYAKDLSANTLTIPESQRTFGADELPVAIAAAEDLYEEVMRYRNHLMRTPVHWERAVKTGELAGGGMYLLKDGDRPVGYALCEMDRDKLLINELLAEDEVSFHTICAKVLDSMKVDEAVMLTAACPHGAQRFGMVRVLDAERMLSYAAEYRRDMECAFEVSDQICTWNTSRYEISGLTVKRGESTGSRAYITPGQLAEILFGAGPLPYINLLFS
jgi:predicted acetyltransferase